MRLLLDQNLAPRLVDALVRTYPGTAHVRELGLHRASDAEIWNFARENGFVIPSKDSGFRQMSFLRGHPPKVVWVNLGNASTDRILQVIRVHGEDLVAFDQDDEAALLTLR